MKWFKKKSAIEELEKEMFPPPKNMMTQEQKGEQLREYLEVHNKKHGAYTIREGNNVRYHFLCELCNAEFIVPLRQIPERLRGTDSGRDKDGNMQNFFVTSRCPTCNHFVISKQKVIE